MVRLAAMLLAFLLVLAACGETDSGPPPTETGSTQAGDGTQSSATPESATATPTVEASPTQPRPTSTSEDDTESIAASSSPTKLDRDSEKPGTPILIEPTATLKSRPSAAVDPTIGPPDPTATVTPTPGEPSSPFPTFPPIPELTSCEHAADLMIEVIQVWLDAMDALPENPFETSGAMPPEFDQFSAEMDAHGTEIIARAERIGCSSDEIEMLFSDRLDQLVANNPTAELILALLLAEQDETPKPPPTTSTEVGWTIETCEDAADVFIDRVQMLLLDPIAGMTIAEMEAMEEGPVHFLQFFEEFILIHEESLTIGCSDEDVTVLVGERLDLLVPDGEAAEEIVASIREAVAGNELFSGIG